MFGTAAVFQLIRGGTPLNPSLKTPIWELKKNIESVIYFLIRMLRLRDVIWVNAMWDGGSALIETLFAYFMFGERLKQPVNYAGLALIMLGLFMLRNG